MGVDSQRRLDKLQSVGESYRILSQGDLFISSGPTMNEQLDEARGTRSRTETVLWNLPAPMFCTRAATGDSLQMRARCPSLSGALVSYLCFDCYGREPHEVQAVTFNLCYGDGESFGLFVRATGRSRAIANLTDEVLAVQAEQAEEHQMNLEEAADLISRDQMNHALLWQYLENLQHFRSENEDNAGKIVGSWSPLRDYALPADHLRALSALDAATDVYESLEGSTISLKVVSKPLRDIRWAADLIRENPNAEIHTQEFIKLPSIHLLGAFGFLTVRELSRAQKFACIAWFESGSSDLQPAELQGVVALASANSIFVASELLGDPSDLEKNHNQVRRVIGNIGRPEMSLLVIPKRTPRIRPLRNNFHIVPDENYDFRRKDNFQGTSLHLSFTNWKRVLDSGDRGAIDEEACLVEAVVSVHDRGQWVADIDISSITDMVCEDYNYDCVCGNMGEAESLISLDHWEEILDSPQSGAVGIVRAKDNWVARLAAAAILSQQGKGEAVIIVPKTEVPCMKCLPATWVEEMGSSLRVIID
jgi:hypothetical protein